MGELGLRKAVLAYDPRRPARLSTYAWAAVSRHMQAAVRRHNRIVSLTPYLYAKAAATLCPDLAALPAGAPAVAAEGGGAARAAAAAQLRFWMRTARPMEDEDVFTAGQPEQLDPEGDAADQALAEHAVREALSALPPRQLAAVCLRYGLQEPACEGAAVAAASSSGGRRSGSGTPPRRQAVVPPGWRRAVAAQGMTFKQVGAVLGVSAVQAGKDCAAAVEALRHHFQRARWLPCDGTSSGGAASSMPTFVTAASGSAGERREALAAPGLSPWRHQPLTAKPRLHQRRGEA